MADPTPWDEQSLRALVGKLRDDESCNAVADLAADAIECLLTREAEVRGEERERAARIADDIARQWIAGEPSTAIGKAHRKACEDIATAIRDGATGGDGWRDISEAPHACHVLAARLDDCEWVYAVVTSPPTKPFTHFRMLPAPPAVRGDGRGEDRDG